LADRCLINAKYLGDEIKKWAKLPKVKNTFRDPFAAAVKLVETEFLMPIQELGSRDTDITTGQLNSFKYRLKELNNAIDNGKIDNKFATTFWQTSHYGKKDPIVGSILRNMQLSNFYFRENESSDKHLMQSMLGGLEKEAISRGLMDRMGFSKRRAQKEMQRLDDTLQQELVKFKNGESKNTDGVAKARLDIDTLISKTYLTVYNDLMGIVEGKYKENDFGEKIPISGLPKIEMDKFNKLSEQDKAKVKAGKIKIKLTPNDFINVKMANGEEISKDMYNSLVSYTSLMESLYNRLRNGVRAKIDSEIAMHSADGKTANQLKGIREKLEAKMMPKHETGYFPHYTRDLNADFMSGLMPMFDEIQTSNIPYLKNKKNRTVSEIINNMNNYIDGHAKHRSEDYQYSKNFLNTITNYVYDVNRFNYLSYMDKHLKDGLRSVENIYKLDGNAKGYGQSVVNYIEDLHAATNGNANTSPKTRAVMRSLLGMEFISKLGINPRGAVRNWTQRLLDYVEWGPVQVRKTDEIISRLNIDEASIEKALKRYGLLFEDSSPQLIESEVSGPASLFKTLEYDEVSGKYKFVKKSRIEKIADKVGWAAGKASYLHRKAENSNRKHTFRVGFAQMYDWLNTPKYRRILSEKNPDYSEKQINSIIHKKSGKYATNMVILNHFDYAEYAKSPLLRTNVGKFMGQFQHYSFEFFERNMRILREAKHDVATGHILPGQDAQGLSKAYRMAIVYFGAPVIASALMGVDFSNLVQHDTAQRLKQLAVVMTGDDDEIKQAFYGKGPIISTFGGAITSDILDIGVMMDLINLDDGSIGQLITGMEKHDPSTRSSDFSRKLRILNSFAGRLVERHIPQLMEGRIGWAVQQELGLYPTAEARKIQRKTKKLRKQIIPENIESLLQSLEKGKL
jgi:hypothetical protein